MDTTPRLRRIVAAQPYPLLFATISGAHLYGFPSPDSDFDLRGSHVLPLENIVGLQVRAGLIEANLLTLNEEFRLPFLRELIERKLTGPEKSTVEDPDIDFHKSEYHRLRRDSQTAHEESRLPELPSDATRAALDALLVRVCTQGLARTA